MDTSKITGKTYLPIFINESLIDVYGDAKLNKVKEKIKANKTSGFNGINKFIFCKRLIFGLQHLQ
jgi:iron uptake system EfeUOB component EfeO/EfeM